MGRGGNLPLPSLTSLPRISPAPTAPGRSLDFEVNDLRPGLDLDAQRRLWSFHIEVVGIGAGDNGDVQPRVVYVAIQGGDGEPLRAIDGRQRR